MEQKKETLINPALAAALNGGAPTATEQQRQKAEGQSETKAQEPAASDAPAADGAFSRTDAEPATQWHNPRIGDVVQTAQGIFLILDNNKNGVHRAFSTGYQETSVHPADVLKVLGHLGKTFGQVVEETEAQE